MYLSFFLLGKPDFPEFSSNKKILALGILNIRKMARRGFPRPVPKEMGFSGKKDYLRGCAGADKQQLLRQILGLWVFWGLVETKFRTKDLQ